METVISADGTQIVSGLQGSERREMPVSLTRMLCPAWQWVLYAPAWGLVAAVCAMCAAGLTCAAEQAQESPAQQGAATIRGAVTDPSGSAIPGAVVALEASRSAGQRTTITDEAGGFRFSAVAAGTYQIKITASGFAAWTETHVASSSGEDESPISAVLRLAPTATQVTVGLPPHERAAQQVAAEEKQRLAGIFPHYFVTYEPNAAPLTAAQKFQLGWKSFFDPAPILFSGISAGIQQARNSYAGYGQGTEGYFKRFGANYADRVDGILIGHVVMQSVFHQDPRYFYKGRGSFGSRVLYAIGTAFAAKGDNGHWQPGYADVLGGMASYELSTLYRPGTSRPWRRLGDTVLLGFSGRATGNLLEEFILRKITTHVPKSILPPPQPTLRAGTAVSLISVEDLSKKRAEDSGPIAFVVASDIQVGGVVLVKAGTQAWGRVTYSAGSDADGGAVRMDIQAVRLTVGKVQVPLRSTQLREGGGAMNYHRLENSGRIAITLYVDSDVPLAPAK